MQMPPMLPVPPGSNLADIIETQARTIRYLLTNYNQLLAKVESEQPGGAPWIVGWQLGAPQNFIAGSAVPLGPWFNSGSAALGVLFSTGGTVQTIQVGQSFDSTGTAAVQSAATLTPLIATLVPVSG